MATRKDLSLRWLEVFQICAKEPSLQATADKTGLSVSTVSHHVQSLEKHLGVPLFDHSRRPMVLTPTGRIFLRNIGPALTTLRKAKAEAAAGTDAETRYLRIGTIEDVDSDIVPELAIDLAARMPHCEFLYHTDSSREILRMLSNHELDMGLIANPPEQLPDLQDRPILRDPFVLVLPADCKHDPLDVVAGKTALPFLRFSPGQIIAQQIEAHLRRMRLSPPHGFECGNNQTLMAMVSVGAGWTVTTPLLFARGERFHDKVQMHRFPGKRFSRTLSLVSGGDCSGALIDRVETRLRDLITQHALSLIHGKAPWLKDQFCLLD